MNLMDRAVFGVGTLSCLPWRGDKCSKNENETQFWCPERHIAETGNLLSTLIFFPPGHKTTFSPVSLAVCCCNITKF